MTAAQTEDAKTVRDVQKRFTQKYLKGLKENKQLKHQVAELSAAKERIEAAARAEAAALTQLPVTNTTEAETAARKLQDLGATNVVITMGSQGALLLQDKNAVLVPAIPVDTIDTTAAGDAFAGALAVRWAQTDDLLDAVRFANVAGAIAASRRGAQNSMGTKHEIDELLLRQAK